MADGILRRTNLRFCAADVDIPKKRIGAKNGAQQLGAPSPYQTGNPQDFIAV